jgi:hypothetical protein
MFWLQRGCFLLSHPVAAWSGSFGSGRAAGEGGMICASGESRHHGRSAQAKKDCVDRGFAPFPRGHGGFHRRPGAAPTWESSGLPRSTARPSSAWLTGATPSGWIAWVTSSEASPSLRGFCQPPPRGDNRRWGEFPAAEHLANLTIHLITSAGVFLKLGSVEFYHYSCCYSFN